MKLFWVEGLYIPKGKKGPAQPFFKSFWARSAEDALEEARLSEAGATWVSGPRIARQSEEQRMRQMGAPELPGLDKPLKKRK